MRKLFADLKRLWRHAALIGAVVAVVCHLVPPHYRVACDALASLCRMEGNDK